MAEYIEREAAAKLIKSVYIEELLSEWHKKEFDNVCVISKKELLDIPAADVKPVVHGKWIENDNGTYTCSECQTWVPNEQHYYARYCLHCGARMGVDDE